MSDDTFENCTAGTFYGFTNKENNEFHPGDTFQLQWGAYDEHTPLNISLARLGGSLVSDILEFGVFSTSSSLYRIYSPSSNCTLEQYNWTIPADFNTTNPQYSLALLNATQERGKDGNSLYGFLTWSPLFYVRSKSSTTSSTTGTRAATTVASASGTSTSSISVSTSITDAQHSSDGLSSGAKAGIGIGVGIAGLCLLGLLFFFFRRRSARAQVAVAEKEPLPIVHEMDASARIPELDSGR